MNHEPEKDDPLAAAKGIMCGFLLAMIVWLAIVGIGLTVYWIRG